MKCCAKFAALLLSVAAIQAIAQSAPKSQRGAQETQARGFWTDPSTGLMWAGKDNGKDVNWRKATKYCRDLRLAGSSDWTLATIDELQGIYDRSAKAPGLAGRRGDEPFTFHVKGNLFLTGDQWSSTQRQDDRGRPSGFVWYFDFGNGIRNNDDASRITGRFSFRRALCVRRSGK